MPTNPQADPRARIAHALRSIIVVGGAPPTRLVPVLDAANPRMARIADWQPLDALVDELLAATAPAVVPSAPADRAELRKRIAGALTAAAHQCDGNCGLSERDCYAAHPITWSAMAGGTTHIDASVTAIADVVLAVLPAPADRAATLREAADTVARLIDDGEHDPDCLVYELRRMARAAEKADEAPRPETQAQCPGFETQPNRCSCGCEGCRHNCAAHQADEAQQPETQAEDPARIDRLRPEFTEHSSVESIDVQLRRARAQERRWHLRAEWLISLRQARVEQKARGEWPAAVSKPAEEPTS